MAPKTVPSGIKTVRRDDPPHYLAMDEEDDVVISEVMLSDYVIVNYTRQRVVQASEYPVGVLEGLLGAKKAMGIALLRCDELEAYLAIGHGATPILLSLRQQRPDIVAREIARLEEIVGAQFRNDSMLPPALVHRVFIRRDPPYDAGLERCVSYLEV